MKTKAVVVGAGVLGASVAYQLAKRGCEVEILEQGIPGDAASAASFAWLNSNTKEFRPYHDINAMSMVEHSVVARELGDDSWLHYSGNLAVAATEKAAADLLARVERLHSYGYPALVLEPSEFARIDPAVRVHEDYLMGVLFPSEGHVDAPGLVRALLAAATSMGAVLRPFTAVSGLVSDGGTVTGVVLADGGVVRADVVVLAGGSGIGPLLSDVGFGVSTTGAIGVSVVTAPGVSALRTVLHLPGLSVRPDTGGRVMMRAKDVDFRVDADAWTVPGDAVDSLADRVALRLADAERSAIVAERVKIAYRPYPLDGMPVVGPWNDTEGLYVVTMHSGVTMSAIMGRLAAEEIASGAPAPLLEPFRPSRLDTATPVFDPHGIEGEA